MTKNALLRPHYFLNFELLGMNAGISNRSLGNMSINDPGAESRLSILKGFCCAKSINMILPCHRTDIEKARLDNQDYYLSADAIYVGDKVQGLVLLIHCSWITLSDKIIAKSVEKVCEKEKIDSHSLRAFIYPGICQNCYGVRSDVLNRFTDPGQQIYFKRCYEDYWLFDLCGLMRHELMSLGLEAGMIRTQASCSAHSLVDRKQSESVAYHFYSFRARKESERNMVFVRPDGFQTVLGGLSGDCPYAIVYLRPAR